MKITSILIPALASIAAAAPDFAIGTPSRLPITFKDTAQLASATSYLMKIAESYQASVTAQPEWTSAYSALVEFQKTGKDVPPGVTATDSVLTYATTPDWYNAMPTDLKNYVEKNRKEQEELLASVVASLKGDAATSRGLSVYIHGAIAAAVAGVAVML